LIRTITGSDDVVRTIWNGSIRFRVDVKSVFREIAEFDGRKKTSLPSGNWRPRRRRAFLRDRVFWSSSRFSTGQADRDFR